MNRPARKPSLQTQLKEASRTAILDAASDVFTLRGRDAKMSEIAERAGVATGTLYNYFKSKEHVFDALAQRGKEEFKESLQRSRLAARPLERLTQIVTSAFTFLDERGALFAVHVERESSRIVWLSRPAAKEPVRELIYQLTREAIREGQEAGLIRQDAPLDLLVHSLLAFMEGAIATWLLGGRREALSPQAEVVVRLFIQGAHK
ncbi:MAG: TetR/AcrR family transcriptional regulator [Polyangiaceae bacterium]|nr:TetR/AcrR family transcriptional regulator [Polyangiaceae bacterium]